MSLCLNNICHCEEGVLPDEAIFNFIGDCFVAHLPWRAVPEKNKSAPRNDMET